MSKKTEFSPSADAAAPCTLCPRACGVNRTRALGRCRSGSVPHVALAAPHHWEEPGISGPEGSPGSGTVFFAGCPLGCLFCQNHAISRDGARGRPVTTPELAQMFLGLQGQGVHNLNLVTATHWRPWVLAALELATAQGLCLPVVWNTGGYETQAAIRQLGQVVSVWLFDVKYHDPHLAHRLCGAPDYWPVALAALVAAHKAAGPARQQDGLVQSGVVLRLLVLPGHADDAIAVLRGVAEKLPPGEVLLSLMRQYTPNGDPALPRELRRPLSTWEYRRVQAEAQALGFAHGWTQSPASATGAYVPPFEG